MTRSKRTSLSIALALSLALAVSAIAFVGAPAAANHDDGSVRSYVAEQDDRCIDLRTLGDGRENVTDFYGYQPNEAGRFSSHGTTDIQRSQTSQVFVYHGTEGVSLVFLHDSLEEDEQGGAISMSISQLPAEGRWVVEDDDYGNDTDDRFEHGTTSSEIDWMWAPGRTDGGVFRGIESLQTDDTIVVDPAFGEESYAYTDRTPSWPYAENETHWRVRDGDGNLAPLDEGRQLRIRPGTCADTSPTADLTADPSSATLNESVTLDASGSFDEGNIVAYHWDVDGDGTVDTTTESDGTITTSYGTTGTVSPTVTVEDDSGNTATADATVTVSDETPPVVRANANRTSVEVGDPVAFDGSDSTDNVGITAVEWNFDDGTANQNATATYAFESTGTYDVTFTATDEAGNANATTIGLDVSRQPPTVGLQVPDAAATDETVTFDASGSDDVDGIAEYRWDVENDGSVDDVTTEPTLGWNFSTAGDHAVNLTVVDGDGETASTTGTVNVTDPEPTAEIDVDATTVTAGTPVSFDGSASTYATTYEWVFGDGSTGTGATATHAYGSAGTYTVNLTVANGDGDTDWNTTTITVEASEPDDGDGTDGGNDDSGNDDSGNDDSGNDGGGGDTNYNSGGGGVIAPDDDDEPSPSASAERRDDGSVTITVENAVEGETVSAAVPDDEGGSIGLRAIELVPANDADRLTFTLVPDRDVTAPNGTDAGLYGLAVENGTGIRSVTYQFAVDRDALDADDRLRVLAGSGANRTTVDHAVVENGSTMRLNATADDLDGVVLATVRPDLSSSALSAGSPPTAGEPVTVEATLTNDGHAVANRTVELVVDGEVVDATAVEVPARGTVNVSFETTFESAGDRRVSVAGTERTISVASPEAHVELVDVSLDRQRVSPGDPVVVTATFENTGRGAGTATANFSVVGDVVSVEHVSVEPGDRVSVTFEESIDAAGTFTVGVNGEQRTVAVGQSETGTDTTTTRTPSSDGGQGTEMIVAGFGVLVIGAAALIRFL